MFKPKHRQTKVLISVGTCGIILQAPTLYDTRPAIDQQISEIVTPISKKLNQEKMKRLKQEYSEY